MILKLKRVPYGKKSTLDEDKEYQIIDGSMFSPVGTLREWQMKFPTAEIQIVKELKNE